MWKNTLGYKTEQVLGIKNRGKSIKTVFPISYVSQYPEKWTQVVSWDNLHEKLYQVKFAILKLDCLWKFSVGVCNSLQLIVAGRIYLTEKKDILLYWNGHHVPNCHFTFYVSSCSLWFRNDFKENCRGEVFPRFCRHMKLKSHIWNPIKK